MPYSFTSPLEEFALEPVFQVFKLKQLTHRNRSQKTAPQSPAWHFVYIPGPSKVPLFIQKVGHDLKNQVDLYSLSEVCTETPGGKNVETSVETWAELPPWTILNQSPLDYQRMKATRHLKPKS